METKAPHALRTAIALSAVAVFACASAPVSHAADAGAYLGNLLDVTRFASLDPASDPQADHRPAVCALGAARIEDATLEFDTNDCVLFWVGVPLVAPVRAGEPLRLVTTHGSLVARVPALAHLRIDLEDEVLVDRTVPIPSTDSIDLENVTPTQPHAAGSLVRVHLHNHGQNTWRLVSLGRRP